MNTLIIRHTSGLAHRAALAVALSLTLASGALAQLAIIGERVFTMGPAGTIDNAVVLIDDKGKIALVGPLASTTIPAGTRTINAKVVTPGLVDARSTLGLSGITNSRHDSDQLERSAPVQPELRALDAYNPQEPLVAFTRSFGITTVNTGHAPGELVSGQTLIVKLRGETVDAATVRPTSMVAATLSPQALKDGGKSPGTRAKQMAMLRAELIKAQEHRRAMKSHADKLAAHRAKPDAKPEDAPKPPERNLRTEMFVRVLERELPIAITAHRAQDIASALRLKEEFELDLILDGACEAGTMIEQIKQAGVPVVLHPMMMRAVGETENASFETAAKLKAAGITVAIQSGYEAYVPKARIILLEAAIAAANGMSQQDALATITIDAARILRIDSRVGSLEPGKDADLAMYSGDPFEYTTRCIGVVIDGQIVSDQPR